MKKTLSTIVALLLSTSCLLAGYFYVYFNDATSRLVYGGDKGTNLTATLTGFGDVWAGSNNVFAAGTTQFMDHAWVSNRFVVGYYDADAGMWFVGQSYVLGITNPTVTGGSLDLVSHAKLYSSVGGSVYLYPGAGSVLGSPYIFAAAGATIPYNMTAPTGTFVQVTITATPAEPTDAATVGWVQSQFQNGVYYYLSTNETTSGYDGGVASYEYQLTEPEAFSRTYNSVTANQYIGQSFSPVALTNPIGPALVGSWLSVAAGSVTIKPELYFTTDKTNTFYQAEDQVPQSLASTTPYLFQWNIHYPNQMGDLYVMRRFKIVSKLGNPDVTIYGGTNTSSILSIQSQTGGGGGGTGDVSRVYVDAQDVVYSNGVVAKATALDTALSNAVWATFWTAANQSVFSNWTAATYLGLTAKAADSDKVDGIHAAGFYRITGDNLEGTMNGRGYSATNFGAVHSTSIVAVSSMKVGTTDVGLDYLGGTYFQAYCPTNQTVVKVSWTKLNMMIEEYDYGNCYNPSTYEYVTPESGVYNFAGAVTMVTSPYVLMQGGIYTNGLLWKLMGGVSGGGTGYPTIHYGAMSYLPAGVTCSVWVAHYDSVNRDTYCDTSSVYTYWSGGRIR